jgi:DNA-directed RNA polymerase subunit RPC12/RpoP
MHYLNLAMISVFPGSFLYKYACETGIIQDRQKFLLDGCPLVNVSKLTQEEYRDLTSRITELRLHPHVPAGKVTIHAINPDGECETEFICRKCGVATKLMASFWFGREIRCPACGLTNFIDPFQDARHLPEDFYAHLPDDRSIVLWGAGGIYYKLMQKYASLSSPRFILVDANPSLHGLSICNKEVHAPGFISQANIQTVIITALSRKHEIQATLREKYPSVKNFLIPSFDLKDDRVVPVLRPN